MLILAQICILLMWFVLGFFWGRLSLNKKMMYYLKGWEECSSLLKESRSENERLLKKYKDATSITATVSTGNTRAKITKKK